MSEEQQEVTIEQLQEQLTNMQSQLEAATNEKESIKSHADKLLDEVKASKNAKREAESQAQAIARDKALKEENFKQLFESSEEQRNTLETQLNKLQGNISQEKVNNAAMKIAAELADGANAEILSEFVARRLKFTDEGLKVTDADGNLTVSSLSDLNQEFASNAKYKSLVRGNQASGGGANGGGGSAPENKQMERAAFEGMGSAKQMKFIQDGGKLI